MIALAVFLFVLFPAPMLFLIAFAVVFGEWMLPALIAVVFAYLLACAADTLVRETRERRLSSPQIGELP